MPASLLGVTMPLVDEREYVSSKGRIPHSTCLPRLVESREILGEEVDANNVPSTTIIRVRQY